MVFDETRAKYTWKERAELEFKLIWFLYFWNQSEMYHLDVWENQSKEWRMSKRFINRAII